MELKPKDEHILTALLSCGSIAEAEKISGVSRTTIYNRLADETFKAEYDRRRSLVLNEACNSLQATLTKAVDTIKGYYGRYGHRSTGAIKCLCSDIAKLLEVHRTGRHNFKN